MSHRSENEFLKSSDTVNMLGAFGPALSPLATGLQVFRVVGLFPTLLFPTFLVAILVQYVSLGGVILVT